MAARLPFIYLSPSNAYARASREIRIPWIFLTFAFASSQVENKPPHSGRRSPSYLSCSCSFVLKKKRNRMWNAVKTIMMMALFMLLLPGLIGSIPTTTTTTTGGGLAPLVSIMACGAGKAPLVHTGRDLSLLPNASSLASTTTTTR